MTLCATCENIDFIHILKSTPKEVTFPREFYPSGHDLFYYNIDTDIRLYDGVVFYRESVEDLIESARSCDLCHLIYKSVDKALENRKRASKGEYTSWHKPKDFQFWLCGTSRGDGVQILAFRNDSNRPSVFCGLNLRVHEASPLNEIVKGRTPPVSPIDPVVIKNLKQWLMAAYDVDAGNPPSSRLPSRLLQISEDGTRISIMRTSTVETRYTALSHCWGSSRPLALTKDNSSRLQEGIDISSLPQSFQDAIWLTRELGLRRLWIDSLCIVQDNLEDWSRESAKMGDVYENAVVTIAASRASSCDEGFLMNHNEEAYISITCRSASLTGEVQIYPVPIKQAGASWKRVNLQDEPLTQRGWTLQERVLSRRILHFGRSQILFEHAGLIQTQDSIDPVIVDQYYMFGKSGNRQDWYRLIEKFSSRKLTKGSDKLPALAGLASRFVSSFEPRSVLDGNCSARYLAGIWYDDMIDGMGWLLSREDGNECRPRDYRAPSWSWASIDGTITHQLYPDRLAVVKEAHTTPMSLNNPFGEVLEGWAVMQGILLRPSPVSERTPGTRALPFCEDGVEFFLSPQWDCEFYHPPVLSTASDPGEIEPEFQVILIAWNEVGSEECDREFGPFCIIIKPVDHGISKYSHLKGFQRVGAGFFSWVPTQREHLRRLAAEKWTGMMVAEELEDIVLI